MVIIAARLARVAAIIRTKPEAPVLPLSRRQHVLTRMKDSFLARVICVSAENRDQHACYLGRDPRQMPVIHNGVDAPPDSTLGVDAGRSVRAEFGLPAVGC